MSDVTGQVSEDAPLLQSSPVAQPPASQPPPPPSPSALSRPSSDGRLKPARTVTFDPNPVSRTIEASPSSSPVFHSPHSMRGRSAAATLEASPLSYGAISAAPSGRPGTADGDTSAGAPPNGGPATPPVLTAINNRLRRRNTQDGLLSQRQNKQQQAAAQLAKVGPQRSTKNAQKLKLLPNPDFGDDGPDEESGRDVYSQYTRIKDPTARRDAALLGKADRQRLPRVTAYCTANRYDMDNLMRFLKGRGRTRGGNPKLIDECIYTPYDYKFDKNATVFEPANTSSRRRRQNRRNRVSEHSYIGGGRGSGNERDSGTEFLASQGQPSQLDGPAEDGTAATDDPLLPRSFYQERRHSAGEVDADYTPERPLSSGGYEHGEQAVVEEDFAMRSHHVETIDDSVYGNGQHEDGYFSDNRGQQHESQPPMSSQHQRQAEEAVLNLMNGDEMDREAVGDNPLQLRDEFEQQLRGERPVDFDTQVHTPELFLFDYGVIVIWGMSEADEQRFLKELAKFEQDKLAADDVEAEFFNFYYTREYQARIYNDFIALSDKNNYMTKLAISHALAQSVKTSLFEELITSTIDTCKDIPDQIAETGKINLSRSEINMQIGELFVLRINIHLNGSVLDTPELFWVEPLLEPVYQAVRSYLEMDQRVGLLTQRLDVIADLLAVLKEQLSHGHGEMLEWIVIILIATEILVAAVNIVVDIVAG